VAVCPQEALIWSNGRIIYDKSACEPCGRCVTVCPAGAVVNPAVTPAQVQAQVQALIAHPSGPRPRGIVFTCSRGRQGERPGGWFEIEVPCTGMVTAGWLLAPLVLGAGAVCAEPCTQSGCPLDNDESADGVSEFGRAFLKELGEDPRRVAITPMEPIPEALPVGARMMDPFGPTGGGEVLSALTMHAHRDAVRFIEHGSAPLGVVEIEPSACTACGMCGEVCPSNALRFEESPDGVVLSFDTSLCTACGQCVLRCPEIERGAITLTRGVDAASLQAGRVTVHEADVALCEACGNPIAASTLMDRIGELLGDEHAGTLALVSRRCLNCRGR
jgi:ferredoxin